MSEKSWLSCALGTHLYLVYSFWQRDCGWSIRTGSQCVRTEMIRVQTTALKLSPKFSLSPQCVRTGSQCVRITFGLFWIELRNLSASAPRSSAGVPPALGFLKTPRIWLSTDCVRTGVPVRPHYARTFSWVVWSSQNLAKYWVRPHSDPVRVKHPHWASEKAVFLIANFRISPSMIWSLSKLFYTLMDHILLNT